MTTDAIIESGMRFGPFPAGHCFYIEKSKCYASVQEGVKVAEFLLLRQQQAGPAVWILEAKSSVPRDFETYLQKIRDKLVNAFLLGVAALVGRHSVADEELPDVFKELDLAATGFRFLLIIKGVPEENLAVIKDALAQLLNPVIKTWAISPASVVVLNEAGAERVGLILPTQSVGT